MLPSDDNRSITSEDECPQRGEEPMDISATPRRDLTEWQQQIEKFMKKIQSYIEQSLNTNNIQHHPEKTALQMTSVQPTKSIHQLEEMIHSKPAASLWETPTISPNPIFNFNTLEEESKNSKPNRRWSAVIRDAILEEEWQAAGAVACPVLYDQQNPRYEHHDWEIFQQAKKTVTENGIRSEAASAVLDWLFTADVNSLTEPYPHFINRLSAALKAQNDMTEEAKQSMFKLLAFENANSIQQFCPPATRGSLGIDLAAAADATLINNTVHKIPTGVTGPIYSVSSALGALLIERSLAGIAELIGRDILSYLGAMLTLPAPCQRHCCGSCHRAAPTASPYPTGRAVLPS